MNILQSGIPKSGNYWLYTILENLLESGGIKKKSFIQNQPIYEIAKQWDLSQKNQADVDVLDISPSGIVNRISRIYQHPVVDIDSVLDQSTLIWTHSAFYRECLNIYKKFDKVVYIIRDPRAVALSSAKFKETDYSQKYLSQGISNGKTFLERNYEKTILAWTLKILNYLSIKKDLDIYPIFYENLKRNTFMELRGLTEYLELDISDADLHAVEDKVSIKSMKKENPDHVRKGDLYEWKSVLSYNQKKKTDLIAGGLFKRLGYPTSNKDYPNSLSVQKNIDNVDIRRMRYRAYTMAGITSGYTILSSLLKAKKHNLN